MAAVGAWRNKKWLPYWKKKRDWSTEWCGPSPYAINGRKASTPATAVLAHREKLFALLLSRKWEETCQILASYENWEGVRVRVPCRRNWISATRNWEGRANILMHCGFLVEIYWNLCRHPKMCPWTPLLVTTGINGWSQNGGDHWKQYTYDMSSKHFAACDKWAPQDWQHIEEMLEEGKGEKAVASFPPLCFCTCRLRFRVC